MLTVAKLRPGHPPKSMLDRAADYLHNHPSAIVDWICVLTVVLLNYAGQFIAFMLEPQSADVAKFITHWGSATLIISRLIPVMATAVTWLYNKAIGSKKQSTKQI